MNAALCVYADSYKTDSEIKHLLVLIISVYSGALFACECDDSIDKRTEEYVKRHDHAYVAMVTKVITPFKKSNCNSTGVACLEQHQFKGAEYLNITPPEKLAEVPGR